MWCVGGVGGYVCGGGVGGGCREALSWGGGLRGGRVGGRGWVVCGIYILVYIFYILDNI